MKQARITGAIAITATMALCLGLAMAPPALVVS